MGCGGSNATDPRVPRLLAELQETKTKSAEQQNLLRFKIEVMVNMLAMEEKKNEGVSKRVETLKWLLHSQGVAEQTLTRILVNAEKEEDEEARKTMMGSMERSMSFRNIGLVDLSGALSRTQEEFELYKADIFPAFAEEDGKVVAALPNDDFMRQLYQVTEKLSKADIQILALRFGDGSGFVSIPEFLEFFTTPAQVRMAKAATAAVRMSLDLLQILDEEDEEDRNVEGPPDGQTGTTTGRRRLEDDGTAASVGMDGKPTSDGEDSGALLPTMMASHLTSNLDRGVRRLLIMWPFVKKDLESAFIVCEEPDADPQIITLDAFKNALLEKCGKSSATLNTAELDSKIIINTTGKPMKPPAPPPPSVQSSSKAGETSNNKNDKNNKNTAGGAHPPATPVPGATGTTAGAGAVGVDSPLTPDDATAAAGSVATVPPPLVPVVVEPLVAVDVDMLGERFELGGCVHYGHVMQYFRELHTSLALSKRHKNVSLPMAQVSPFRVSSEWQVLRESAVLKQYASTTTAVSSTSAPPKPPAAAAAAAVPSSAEAAPTKPPKKGWSTKTKKEEKGPETPPQAAAADTKKKKEEEGETPPEGADAKGDVSPEGKTADTPDAKTSSPTAAADTPDAKKQPPDSPAAAGGTPPAGPEVVEPSKGFLCCGGGKAAAAPAPDKLPPSGEKTAWQDPDAKADGKENDGEDGKQNEKEEEEEAGSHSDSDSSSMMLPPKSSTGFNTPKDRPPSNATASKKLSFRPRSKTEPPKSSNSNNNKLSNNSDDSDLEGGARAGLGRRDVDESAAGAAAGAGTGAAGRPRAASRGRFHRRDADEDENDSSADNAGGSGSGSSPLKTRWRS